MAGHYGPDRGGGPRGFGGNPIGAGTQFRPIGQGGGGAGPPPAWPPRPPAQPTALPSPQRIGVNHGDYRQPVGGEYDRDLDGARADGNRQGWAPNPQAPDLRGGADGSPNHPRPGGYRGPAQPPFGAPGGARPSGLRPAPAFGAPPPSMPITPNRLPQAQPGEPVIDTRAYRFIHSIFDPPGLNPTWPMSSIQSLAFCLQLTAVVGDEPAAHQALSELDGMCFRAGGAGTSSSTFVDEDVRQSNAKFAILGDLRNVFRYHVWGLSQTLGVAFRPWPIHRSSNVDVSAFYHLSSVGGPLHPPTLEPAIIRRAAVTPFLNSSEAMDLCSAFGVIVSGPDEHDIWNALFDTESHLASNSPQATAFLGAWRGADASLPRQGRMYRALMAAQRGAPLSALPPPPPPSRLTGSDVFSSLFASLIDKSTAVGCALRRINPQERSYNDNAAVNAGMFDGDLIRWLDTKVDEGSISRTAVASMAGDLSKTLAFVHELASKAPAALGAFPSGAPLATFPPQQEHQGRIRVATYLGDDGNKRAETTVFGEMDHRCASELTPKSALIDAALSFAGPPEQRAQLCANLGSTSFNADGSVAQHKADDRLVWAAAKELPESLFSVGGETTLTCQKLLRAREVVETDVQRQAREATRGSVGAGAMARSLPKPVIKNLRQGKILGADEKYSAVTGMFTERRFDNGPHLLIQTNVRTPPRTTPEFIAYSLGRGRFASVGVDVTSANETLWKWTHLIDTAAGNVGVTTFTRENERYFQQQRAEASVAPWDQPQKWDSWMAGIIMLSIAMETWLHSDVPTKKPSLASVFITSVDPLTRLELIELNPSSPFFRRMSQLHLHLLSIGSQPEQRDTSILANYPPVPSASPPAFNPSANRDLTTGPFLQRPPTPGVDIVNKSILLNEAQRIPAAEAKERGLFSVFHNEQDLRGLCFMGCIACGGCPVLDCKFCKGGSKLLFERNIEACKRAALRVVGHSVAPSAKLDDGDRGRDRSRSRDRDGGRDRSASRDRGGGGGDRRGRSPSAGRQ